MKITKIQTWLVRPRWAFVEISTDAGISGWGEPVLEGRAATVCECIHEMEPYLIGADPMKIEDLWTVLFRGGFYRGGGIRRRGAAFQPVAPGVRHQRLDIYVIRLADTGDLGD